MKRSMVLLAAGGFAAASAPVPVQLACAIAGIGILGMVHGAGDLAVVDSVRKPTFVVIYVLLLLVTVVWWAAEPGVALPLFLAASAVHFGMEDAPDGSPAERIARGLALIAAPAALHFTNYAALLRTAGGPSSLIPSYTAALAVAGGLSGAALLLVACRRRDLRLAGGTVALLLLPPLIGFTLGFLILHALPQTAERRDRLGYPSTRAYVQAVAPVFVSALLIAGVVASVLYHFDSTGVRGLFASIAALALPHLLVTPWYEGKARLPSLS